MGRKIETRKEGDGLRREGKGRTKRESHRQYRRKICVSELCLHSRRDEMKCSALE